MEEGIIRTMAEKLENCDKTLTKALGTTEVETLCRKAVQGCNVKFMGVGAAHSLPKLSTLVKERKKACCFVANTQTKEKKGEHWVAFYFPPCGQGGRKPFMFDSYARTPRQLGHPDWEQYMTSAALGRDGGDGEWNRQMDIVQNTYTSVCGVLCAYYLWHAVRGEEAFKRKKIVKMEKTKVFLNNMHVCKNGTNKCWEWNWNLSCFHL